MKTIKRYFQHAIPTYATIGGEYYDDVLVQCDHQSRDDSCNVGEYAEVYSVMVNGIEMLDKMLQSEVEELEERMLEQAYDRECFPHIRQVALMLLPSPAPRNRTHKTRLFS